MMNWFWWVVVVAAFIFEVATVGNIISIWFCFGGIFAGILELLGVSVIWQFVSFVVVSMLSLLILRPLTVKYFKGNIVPTNADRYVGLVVKLDSDCSKEIWGSVTCNSQVWSCVNIADELLTAGTKVKIMAIDGAKFVVRKAERGEEA